MFSFESTSKYVVLFGLNFFEIQSAHGSAIFVLTDLRLSSRDADELIKGLRILSAQIGMDREKYITVAANLRANLTGRRDQSRPYRTVAQMIFNHAIWNHITVDQSG